MNENKTNINCDMGILWKIHLNLWKYSLFYVEIFTCKYIYQWDTGILGKIYSNHWKHYIFNVEIFTYF